MLKEREAELQKHLKEKLPRSDVVDALFEYLAVRVEVEKIRVCKEPSSDGVGRIKELNSLLDLFSLPTQVVE